MASIVGASLLAPTKTAVFLEVQANPDIGSLLSYIITLPYVVSRLQHKVGSQPVADPQADAVKVALRCIAFELETVVGQAIKRDAQALSGILKLMLMGGFAKHPGLGSELVAGEQARANAT